MLGVCVGYGVLESPSLGDRVGGFSVGEALSSLFSLFFFLKNF